MEPWNQRQCINQLATGNGAGGSSPQKGKEIEGEVISDFAACFAYLGETHQSIEGAIFYHQLFDVGQALVEILVLHKILFCVAYKKLVSSSNESATRAGGEKKRERNQN
jgi:hypothetical protein